MYDSQYRVGQEVSRGTTSWMFL